MSEQWYLIHDASGGSVSLGTVVARPLPTGLTAVALTAEQAEGIRGGTARWDSASRSVVALAPPVPETVTRWQLQTWLLRSRSITPAAVSALIATLPTESRAQAEIDWMSAATMRRDHPLVNTLGAALGLLPAEIDQAFREAAELVA